MGITIPNRTTKVLFDPQTFEVQRVGGISRYFVELQKALSVEVGVVSKIGCAFSNNEHLLSSGQAFAASSFRGTRYLNRIAYELGLRWCDVLHSTYYMPEFLVSGFRKRRVVTVYDMLPELYPNLFPSGNPHRAKELYCRTADVIICISEQTRQDLLGIYDVDPERTVTIHLGVEFRRVRSIVEPNLRANFPDPYLLYVGNRGSYKNFGLMLDAFRIVADRDKAVSLIVVGGGDWTDDERRQLDRIGARGRVLLVSANDTELRDLYQYAACFVFPSLYEGFGLPILEAFAEGCPVVLSDNPVFHEVAKDGAIFFAGDDPDCCADAIMRAFSYGSEREIRISRGLEVARGYSWSRTASRHVDVYNRLMSSR